MKSDAIANELEHLEEDSTIGSALYWDPRDPWPGVFEMLEPEHFRHRHNSRIWMAVQDLRAHSKPVDVVAVCSILRDWGETKAMLRACRIDDETPSAANAAHWGALVYEAGRKRILDRQLKEVMDRARGGEDIDSVAAGVLDAVREVERSTAGGLEHVRESLKRYMASLHAESDDPEAGVIARTGLRELDAMLRLYAGDMTIIAGRPSMGKSALAGNIARHCAREARGAVATFSLEMSSESLVERLMQREVGAGRERLLEMARAGQLASTANKIHQLDLYIDDRPRVGIEEIRRSLRKLSRVRLVVVDYLQLAQKEAADRHDLAVGDVTKGLKSIAKEFDCHVIALSQLNRGVEKRDSKRPMLSDLRDSGNIEEDADNVLLLFREEYYFTGKPEAKGIAEIIVGKQRKGATGVVRVAWRNEAQSFNDLAQHREEPQASLL